MNENKIKKIAVDLDGTLAEYHGWQGVDHIGDPIKPMIDRVKAWLKEGHHVFVFTSRLSEWERHGCPHIHFLTNPIKDWCNKHIGCELPITCNKSQAFSEFWDDRAFRVEKNTGVCMSEMNSEVGQILLSGAQTFEQRNTLYKDTYGQFGKLLLDIFPDHKIPEISDPEDAVRLNLIICIANKLIRYGYNFHRGGHTDSAHDLCVYAAMLEQKTKKS